MTTKWKDKKGREWDVALDLLACRRIDSSDFKLYHSDEFSILQLEGPILQKLVSKSAFTFAIIWAIVQPQAKMMFDKDQSFPIDPTTNPEEAELEFVSAINAQAKADGQASFLEALGDFFPELKTGLSSADRQLRNLSKKLVEKMGEMDPLLEEMFEEQMNEGLSQIREEQKIILKGRRGKTLSPSLP